MSYRTETITPKKAQEYLKLNTRNRPLRHTHVARLAQDIRNGHFVFNGDPIRFAGNNGSEVLLDGQHRLSAVVMADRPIESIVIRDLDEAAFDTIDRGSSRTLGDILSRKGEKYYTHLATAARVVWRLEFGEWDRKEYFTPSELDRTLDAYPQLRPSMEFVANNYFNNPMKIISPGAAAALHALCYPTHPRLADKFWERVLTGEDVQRGTPEALLSKRLHENVNNTTKLRQQQIVAMAIKAWNSISTKEPIKVLRFNTGEPMPKLVP
jgi:hypothetical protein